MLGTQASKILSSLQVQASQVPNPRFLPAMANDLTSPYHCEVLMGRSVLRLHLKNAGAEKGESVHGSPHLTAEAHKGAEHTVSWAAALAPQPSLSPKLCALKPRP